MIVLKAVAKCKNIVKSRFSAGKRLEFKKYLAISICPLDEIGKNSVNP